MAESSPRRVFLSHTTELREFPAGRSFVDAAEAAVNRTGGVVIDMAYFSAADDRPSDYCQGVVRSCDVYVGLIGLRYGSPVRDRPDVSYTELEFDTATDAGMPRLIFMLDDNFAVPIPPARLREEPDLQARQLHFRARLLGADVAIRTFSSPERLELEIFHALKSLQEPSAARRETVAGNDFFFAPGNALLFGGFERLRDICFDPSVLVRDLDLGRFTGREWLIKQIDAFIERHDHGYVIVRGEAGVGKSCLAAHLVGTRPWLHHFTDLPGGRSAAAARKSLAAQLIARWGLRDWAPGDVLPPAAGRADWFAGVLHAAARQREASEPGTPIVLVVDGLDYAEEMRGGGLPLGLPARLPDGVYAVATSRFGIERALHAVRNPADWLEIEVEGAANLADMRRFIEHITNADLGDQRLVGVLAASGTDVSSFRDQLAERCAGVWIYLRYVLDEIRDKVQEPSAVGRLPRDLAGFYAEQIERWRGDDRGSPARHRWDEVLVPLLGVLGVSRAPVTAAELAAFAGVPEGTVSVFVEESARAFLRQDDRAGAPRYSVRHQSLRDLLTGVAPDARPDVADLARTFESQGRRAHQRIAAALVPPGEPGERFWLNATEYAMYHLAAHAAECDMLDELVTDPGFLAVISPGSVLAQRANVRTAEGRHAIEAFEMSLGGWDSCTYAERTDRLAVNAAKLRARSLLAASAKMTTADWPISWAAWSGHGHRTLDTHDGWVRAAAVGRAGDRDIIVSGTLQGTLQIWDAVTGELVSTSLMGHDSPVLAVAVRRAAGRDVIVSGSADRTIRIWDASTGQPVGQPLTGHDDNVWSVAIGQAAGRDVIVSGSADRTIRIWDASTGNPVGQPLTGHEDNVWSVAIGQAAGRDVIVSGSGDRTIRIWDASTGHPIGQPLTGHDGGVAGVVVGRGGEREVIASGSNDRTVRIWDAVTGHLIGPPLSGHDDTVGVVAIGRAGDRDIIVSGSNDRTVRIWEAAGEPADEPRAGHDGSVWAVAAGRAGDRDIIVSGSQDRTIRTWDAATSESLGLQPAAHRSAVLAVACGRAATRDIIVSGSNDCTVRICDAITCQTLGPPLVGHRSAVLAVACGRAGDRDIIVSGSDDHTVRIWDAVTRKPIGPPLMQDTEVRAVACGRAGDRDIIVSGSSDGILRIWDARTGDSVSPPLTVHQGWLRAVAVGRAGNSDIIAVGTLSGGVEIWDAITARPVGRLEIGHAAPALAIALGRAGDRDIIVSGDGNGAVRVWDAATHLLISPPLICHSDGVLSLAVGRAGDHDIIVSSSHDRGVFVHRRR